MCMRAQVRNQPQESDPAPQAQGDGPMVRVCDSARAASEGGHAQCWEHCATDEEAEDARSR